MHPQQGVRVADEYEDFDEYLEPESEHEVVEEEVPVQKPRHRNNNMNHIVPVYNSKPQRPHHMPHNSIHGGHRRPMYTPPPHQSFRSHHSSYRVRNFRSPP